MAISKWIETLASAVGLSRPVRPSEPVESGLSGNVLGDLVSHADDAKAFDGNERRPPSVVIAPRDERAGFAKLEAAPPPLLTEAAAEPPPPAPSTEPKRKQEAASWDALQGNDW